MNGAAQHNSETNRKPPRSERDRVVFRDWFAQPEEKIDLYERDCLRGKSSNIIDLIALHLRRNPVYSDDGRPYAELSYAAFKRVCAADPDKPSREVEILIKDLVDAGIIERRSGTDGPIGGLYRLRPETWHEVKPYRERPTYTEAAAKREQAPPRPKVAHTIVLLPGRSHTVTLEGHGARIDNVDLPPIRAKTYVEDGRLIHELRLEKPPDPPPPEPPKGKLMRTTVRIKSPKSFVSNKAIAQMCVKINRVTLQHKGPICDEPKAAEVAAVLEAAPDPTAAFEAFARLVAKRRWKHDDTAGLLPILAKDAVKTCQLEAAATAPSRPTDPDDEPARYSAEWHNRRDQEKRRKTAEP